MARKVNNHHYVASLPRDSMAYVHRGTPKGYSSEGEESHRARHTMSEYMLASERSPSAMGVGDGAKHMSEYTTLGEHSPSMLGSGDKKRHMSEYTTASERSPSMLGAGDKKRHRHGSRAPSAASNRTANHYDNDGSDIYVTSAAYRAPSEISRYSRHSRPASQYSYRSGHAPSEVSTVKTKTSRKGGLVIETMAAPNPFCPNTKGMCCLMLLLNLGLILVTLGFVVVIQFFEPLVVWILGIIFLVFGFLTLIGSLVYCVFVCKDSKSPKDVHPEDLYWTHHWQKNIGSPEVHYKAEKKYLDDRYSDRYSVSKYSGKYSDRDVRSDRY